MPEKMLDMISIFLDLLGFVLWPYMIYFGECAMWIWKKMCFLLFWGEIFFTYLLTLSDLMCHLQLMFLCSLSVWDDLSIDVNGVLKTSTIIVLLSISPFMSVNICFMSVVLLRWVQKSISVIVLWWYNTFFCLGTYWHSFT